MHAFLNNLWLGYSENKRDNAIKKIMASYSGIPLDQYTIERVSISNDPLDYVASLNIMNSKKKDIILIHGFGGTGACFYKYFLPLSKKYNIHALDLRGMGISGRGGRLEYDCDQYEKYFLEGINKYVESKDLKKFTVIAHSLGGYLATLYAQSHPNKIDQLVLLSPAGFSEADPLEILKVNKQVEELNWPIKKMYKKAMKIFTNGESPFILFRYLGRAAYLLRSAYKKYIALPNNREADDYLNLIYQVNCQAICSDRCLGKLLGYRGYGNKPLEKRINLSIPTHFLYGENDFLDSNGAKRYTKSHKSTTFHTIPGAGHSLNIQEVPYSLKILENLGIM